MTLLSKAKNDMLTYNHAITYEAGKEYQIHFHDIYEIYYFIEGDVDYLVEGKTYHPKPYSLLLLSPHVFHGVRINTNKPYERYTLHFNPDLLTYSQRSLLLSSFPNSKNIEEREVYFEDTKNYRLDTLFEVFDECVKQPDVLFRSLYPIYLESLLATITIMCQSLKPMDVSKPISGTILNIIHYLNNNLKENITLDSISDEFFISKHYLNRAFKKATGTTVYDYLIHKRVIYAKQLLLNGYSPTEVAILSGFKDYSNFYRAYVKTIGHSPAKENYTGREN
jgi:AraC-like DNA-binding protein